MPRKYSASALLGSVLLVIVLMINQASSRALYDMHQTGGGPALKPMSGTPNTQFDQHNIGKIALVVTNFGTFGTGYVGTPVINGEEVLACEYPINSKIEYLFAGAVWIGAVVGRDTLVSVGGDGWFQMKELYPDEGDAGAIITRSSLRSKTDFSPLAVSEQDFICSLSDTNTDPSLTGVDPIDNRPHIPLGVSVHQNTYAWSYDYAEDFVLFDYKIANISPFPIKDMYIAMYVDADVFHTSNSTNGAQDDICGFRRTVPMPSGYGLKEDTINVAWIADNDGDPTDDGSWAFTSPVAVTGTRVLLTPNDELQYSFNWWISNQNANLDFGPRLAGTNDKPFRSFGTWLGTPTGDKNKYYVMSSGEFDYDQLFVAVDHTAEGYLPPPRPDLARIWAGGLDTRYLLSFGPFTVQPNDTLPITLAYVAGDNFHVGPTDFLDYFDPFNPSAYYNKLSFKDLGDNARWASWIFDNPGYDTPDAAHPEGDGDSGRYYWKCQGADSILWFPENYRPPESLLNPCTKVYYKGDGVPDFRGAAPPPPPELKVIPRYGDITIRWNGQITENSVDVFSQQKDFEGYRVYYAEGNRLADFVLLTSYDLNDYKVYQFNRTLLVWEQVGPPSTLDGLRALYGADFDPSQYDSEFRYFTDPAEKLLYFRPQDWNQSDLTDTLKIHKVYPTASKVDSSDTTEDGWLRYYEYEYHIPNLLPSIPYNFSVTAFDYGSLKSDLGALESSPLVNAVQEYPLPSADSVEVGGLPVMVYPNPYRIDGGYAAAGYENRERIQAADRARAVHFANLPKVCKIRIYTLNGDLGRELDHY